MLYLYVVFLYFTIDFKVASDHEKHGIFTETLRIKPVSWCDIYKETED